MYEYACDIRRLVDGSTVDLAVDLGFNVWLHKQFRLKDINAPEVRGKERELGKKATAHLEYLIQDGINDGGRLVVRTERVKKGWVATILLIYDTGETDLNQQMVKDGYAAEKEY